MATKSSPGGMILVYGVAIGNALANEGTTVAELQALRAQAQAIVDGHGDLTAALAALDKEISGRGRPTGPTLPKPPPPTRFVVQMDGLAIPPDAKATIEKAINAAVQATLAKHEVGKLSFTPLSQIRTFGAGLGGATAGMVVNVDV